ncbi:MAG: NAD(P)/FAD-dependent oxidoreductase, partial [Arenicellales bacterium]|nr:NAD(P)/FAD-dependent oxidoreductase [Arenicellales bacterium]
MSSTQPTNNKRDPSDYDVLIVGAGFSGLYLLHRLRGSGFRVRVVDRASDVGGTWYWNRYPGARCDVESMQYAYSFCPELEQEWVWTEKYATQPEILSYARHVAERFDLRRDIELNTTITSAVFDESRHRWLAETSDGRAISTDFCIMATGCLSTTNTPKFEGQESFAGPVYHTGEWPHKAVDFTGQKVGVIGTGSSAIQAIPLIAEQAEHLYVFQRTPHYTIPAWNRMLESDPASSGSGRKAYGYDADLTIEEIKADYAGLRKRARKMFNALAFIPNRKSAMEVDAFERQVEYEEFWQRGGVVFLGAYADLAKSLEANETAAEFVREKIRQIVKDPVVAETLVPTYTIGCKRLAVDTNYYETYNRSNVTLVDVGQSPIQRITQQGVYALDQEYNLDSLIMATGFDAMTGTLLKIDIRGRDGLTLKEKWAEGPKGYLGLGISGFPNFFMITGPGSPSVLTNMMQSIEQHVDWVVACLEYLRTHNIAAIEATQSAEDDWVAHNDAMADDHMRNSC